MNQAIQTLMEEHRVIEEVLGSLETFVDRMDAGEEVARDSIRDYADFFRNFADRCHHGKEEDRLFALMGENGFPSEYGPIAVMLAEHTEGRAHVKALFEAGEAPGLLAADDKLQVSRHARAYISLLRSHIVKEDNILYPMALQAIRNEEMEALGEAFELFEREVMGEGTHAKYHALVRALVAAYPPDPAKMAAGAACAGCPGHV